MFSARGRRDAASSGIDRLMRYELWRQDDNGNRLRIDVFATVVEAEAARAMYEARGHKQMYWVEPSKDAEDTKA